MMKHLSRQALLKCGRTVGALVLATLLTACDALGNADLSTFAGGSGGAPTITSFTPTEGVVGTTVTLVGINFSNATEVTFNGAGSVAVTPVSGKITVKVPTGATKGAITVTNDKGTGSSVGIGGGGSFTVNPPTPTITTFSPSDGVAGNTVTISGTHLSGATSVSFTGGGSAVPTHITDGSSMRVVVPEGTSTGAVTVTTATTDGTGTASGTSAASFRIVTKAPTITSASPWHGAAGATVTISGTSFTGATSVRFANSTLSTWTTAIPTVVSSTSITVTVPAAAAGVGPISVTTAVGTGTSLASFTVDPPTLTGFTPTSGLAGATVTISGTSFTGATWVYINGTAAKFTIVSITSITATVPATALEHDVGQISVHTPSGTVTSLASFTVLVSPTITSFTPTSGIGGAGVGITGTGFTGVTSVKFNGTTAEFSFGTSTINIHADVPSAATTGKISVSTAGGTATSTADFSVTR